MSFARFAGIVVQAVALGTLLFLAIVKLTAYDAGLRVFQYQGF
ncbi:MAG: hypothetical protein ABSH20_24465 [Tepidisphaeraceae bacterium]|jgi:hypothetical protein